MRYICFPIWYITLSWFVKQKMLSNFQFRDIRVPTKTDFCKFRISRLLMIIKTLLRWHRGDWCAILKLVTGCKPFVGETIERCPCRRYTGWKRSTCELSKSLSCFSGRVLGSNVSRQVNMRDVRLILNVANGSAINSSLVYRQSNTRPLHTMCKWAGRWTSIVMFPEVETPAITLTPSNSARRTRVKGGGGGHKCFRYTDSVGWGAILL